MNEHIHKLTKKYIYEKNTMNMYTHIYTYKHIYTKKYKKCYEKCREGAAGRRAAAAQGRETGGAREQAVLTGGGGDGEGEEPDSVGGGGNGEGEQPDGWLQNAPFKVTSSIYNPFRLHLLFFMHLLIILSYKTMKLKSI